MRDEAEVYAKKLNRSGARVRQLHYPDLFHGFVNLTGLRACKTAVDDMIDEMRNFMNKLLSVSSLDVKFNLRDSVFMLLKMLRLKYQKMKLLVLSENLDQVNQ